MYDLSIGDLLQVKNDDNLNINNLHQNSIFESNFSKINNLDTAFDGTKDYKMTIKDRS